MLLLMLLISLFLLKLILFLVPVLIIHYSEFGSLSQADIILPLMNTSILSQNLIKFFLMVSFLTVVCKIPWWVLDF